MPFRRPLGAAAACMFLALTSIAGAQSCEPAWESGYFAMPQPIGSIQCAVKFDDGTGEAIYLAGAGSASGQVFDPGGVARLRDGAFEPVPGLVYLLSSAVAVRSLLVHDDGSGPALYAAGLVKTNSSEPPQGVVRYREGAWEPLNSGVLDAYALAEFDEDGDGPAPPRLFVAGAHTAVRRWDGQSWTSIGNTDNSQNEVLALTVGDDGSGSALYAGGRFLSIAGVDAVGVARWDGNSWSPLGGGVAYGATGGVCSLAWHDDGSGRALYAGGFFGTITADGLAYGVVRWDGEQWRSLGLAEGSDVRGIASQSLNGVDELVIAGMLLLDSPSATPSFARWTGESFTLLPNQPQVRLPYSQATMLRCMAVAPHEEGLLALGQFDSLGDGRIARGLALWDGSELRPFPDHNGLLDGVDASAMAADPASGSFLLGGEFNGVGGRISRFVARRDRAGWSSIGDGLNGRVTSVVVHDAGDGPRPYISGNFTNSGGVDLTRAIAAFDGSAWTRVATLDNGEALAMASIGGELYVGGTFGAVENVGVQRIARWDGASWHPLSAGLSGGSSLVRAILPWNGGVAVGGSFTNSAGMTMRNVAFWNGAAWSPLGEGLNFTVRALAEYQGDLYAAGEFTQSGATPMRYIARWDGEAWRPLPGTLSGPARAMTIFDDGHGPRLIVAGQFMHLSGTPFGAVASWDGSAWAPLEIGVSGRVDSLATVAPIGGRRSLMLFGLFTSASGIPSYGVAEWRGCLASCPGDANGDDFINMADLNFVISSFNTVDGDPGYNPAADFDGDGAIGFEELNYILAAFNMDC